MLLTALHVSIATNTTQLERSELGDIVLSRAVKNNHPKHVLINIEPNFKHAFRILGPRKNLDQTIFNQLQTVNQLRNLLITERLRHIWLTDYNQFTVIIDGSTCKE